MSAEPELLGAKPEAMEGGPGETVVDREARNPFYRYLMHLGLPLSVSLCVHFGILVFLGYKTFQIATQRTFDVGQYEASLTDSLADKMKDAFQWNTEDALAAPDEMPPETALDSLTNLQDVSSLDTSALQQGAGVGDSSGLGIGDGNLTLLGTGGFGSGLGGGGARIGQAGIWNLNIRANKIVYVIDYSGSIIVAVDDLKRELKRSIGKLKASQSFTVILFYSTGSGVKTESFKPKLEAATEESRREFFQWIDRKAPQGDTEPLEAMRRALGLNPDAIFFFSDGLFEDSVVTEIGRVNTKARTRIYSLVFDEIYLTDTSGLPPAEKEGSRRMRRIAESNGGQVKIVTGKDLAR